MRTNRKTPQRRLRRMPFLALEDLRDYTEKDVIGHFLGEYQASDKDVEPYRVLVAYESVGSWGCDSNSWFLLQNKRTGKLYEVHGSHCSCYGFEGQFTPEETTFEYLLSDHFHFCHGGYDSNAEGNFGEVKDWLKRNLGRVCKN